VLFTVFGGITALIVERNQWTLQRLAVMPIRRSHLLGGKVLSRFCLGLLQYSVLFAVGAILGMSFGDDPLALLALALTYTLAVTAFSFALGTQLKNESQAAGLTLLFSLVFASLGGAWWPLEVVPEWMRVVGHLSPVAWAMDGYRVLIFENGRFADVLIPIGMLLGFAAISFGIALRRFRYTSIGE
jgi:ABC-2 type transport system permease protein